MVSSDSGMMGYMMANFEAKDHQPAEILSFSYAQELGYTKAKSRKQPL